MSLNRRLPPVRTDQFAMVPRGDVPRSVFKTQHTYKTTLQGAFLYPCLVDEVLPGDVYQGKATIFLRMATPLFPIMDNVHAETFFFFVPNRLVWSNWVKFMGERKSPSDSINYLVPTVTSPTGGFAVNQLADHFGLPVAGGGAMDPAGVVNVNALPFRAYNLIYNEWFRDENIQTALTVPLTDGPDSSATYTLQRRNKRHDYFTSALPWPTKANDVPVIPIGTQAPVLGIGVESTTLSVAIPANVFQAPGSSTPVMTGFGWDVGAAPAGDIFIKSDASGAGQQAKYPQIYADLSQATGATLNAMRLAVATQQLLERDARGGTRYTELLRNHFGVTPQDSRLQRPEYIGGGRMTLQTQAIPQTSATGLTGGTSPLGALGAATTGADQHHFSYSATEHGFIIGLINVYADITYQQGMHRMWTRSTRYDYYWPAFAFLGEQAIRKDEIYATGLAADDDVWAYQERWAEYRYRPSRLTGLFRSNVTGSLDTWHLAQDFTTTPGFNNDFISDQPPFARVLAAGALADFQQFLMDSVWNIRCTRALPMRSVPGLRRF